MRNNKLKRVICNLKSLNKPPKNLAAFLSIGLLSLFFVPLQGNTQEESNTSSSPEYASPQYPFDSAEAWLAKLTSAVTSLNYSISLVVLKPGVDSQPYLWRHGIDENGVEMEQLNLLNGPGKEVVRIGSKVSYFEPNVPPYSLQSTTINGPFPSDLLYHPESLFDSYEFVLVGRSRVSGRAAQQIRVISRDKSRFGLNLWLDQESGLILKMNMINLEGQLLEQIQVTGIQVSEKPDPYFSRIEQAMLPDTLVLRNLPESPPRWKINNLPIGMHIVKQDIHRLPMTGELTNYILLSDGLVDVSIYLQALPSENASQDLIGRHESNTILTRQIGDVSVTVVGKVPAVTADAILKSIQVVQ
jgi:sigma-E factor negative regulatory protein RseB